MFKSVIPVLLMISTSAMASNPTAPSILREALKNKPSFQKECGFEGIVGSGPRSFTLGFKAKNGPLTFAVFEENESNVIELDENLILLNFKAESYGYSDFWGVPYPVFSKSKLSVVLKKDTLQILKMDFHQDPSGLFNSTKIECSAGGGS